MSDIRFNQWLHQSGTGGVSQDHIGNIGIGTTNPSIVVSAANTAVLNVGVITANNLFVNNAFNGDITGNVTGNISGATGTFSGNIDIADKIIHTGDTDTAMRFPADNTFAVDTAGSERLRIDSAGSVIIGDSDTDNANAIANDLVVGNTSQRSGITIVSGSGDDGNIFFSDGTGTDALKGQIVYNHTGDRFSFYTAATERLRIDSAGQMGVGCTPETDFQVRNGNGGTVKIGGSGSGATGFQIQYSNSGTTTTELLTNYRSTSSSASLKIDTGTFLVATGTNGAERLRITPDGKLGHGTASPSSAFHGTVSSGGYGATFESTANGGESVVTIKGKKSDGTVRSAIFKYDNADMIRLGTSQSIPMRFETGDTERLRISADGYVTKPNQPRFFARRSANYTGYDGRNVGGTWILFDVLDYNVGGGFQTSGSDQGRFVAPVDGLYLFHAAAYKNTGTADWSQSWFDIDGSRANGTDFVHSSSTRFAQNAIQVYLTAGQKIGYHPYNNATNNPIIQTATHTWFKGCLLG